MTPPASKERSPSNPPRIRAARSPEPPPARPQEVSGRRIAATIVGGAAGAVAFAVLLMAGLLLYQRLYGTSASVLVVLGLIFGAAGIYAGWIAATMVFAALRGGGD
jgi:cell division protein FtsW (lipid II flippase)